MCEDRMPTECHTASYNANHSIVKATIYIYETIRSVSAYKYDILNDHI